ncbi:MAG: hypothetical protein S4CHLAM6_11980 [Chlamydiae bacterium]|nr:hypothetical protein [Chlamydiota bacterium]
MAAVKPSSQQPYTKFLTTQYEKLCNNTKKLATHLKNNAQTYIPTTIAIAVIAHHLQYECLVEETPTLSPEQQDLCARLALLPQENNITSALDAITNLKFSYLDYEFDFSATGWLSKDSKITPAELIIHSNCAKQIQSLTSELQRPSLPLEKLTATLRAAAAAANNKLWLKLANKVQGNDSYKSLPNIDKAKYWISIFNKTRAVTMYNPSRADSSMSYYGTSYDAANSLTETMGKRSFFTTTAQPYLLEKYLKFMLVELQATVSLSEVDQKEKYSILKKVSDSIPPFKDDLNTAITEQNQSNKVNIFQLDKLDLLKLSNPS